MAARRGFGHRTAELPAHIRDMPDSPEKLRAIHAWENGEPAPPPPLRGSNGKFSRKRIDNFIERIEAMAFKDPRYAVLLANIFHLTPGLKGRVADEKKTRPVQPLKGLSAADTGDAGLSSDELRALGLAAARTPVEDTVESDSQVA